MNAKISTLIPIFTIFITACSGGGSSDSQPATTSSANLVTETSASTERLLFIDRPSSGSSLRDIYSVNPQNTTDKIQKLNIEQFVQYATFPSLPIDGSTTVHAIAWINENTLWGADSLSESPYKLAESNIIEGTCSIRFKTTIFDGAHNIILLKDNGENGICNDGDDNYYSVNINRSTPQNLTALPDEIVSGLTGGIFVSNTTPDTYSTFIDSNNKLAIFNQTTLSVTSRYDITSNIQWGPNANGVNYVIFEKKLYEVPFNEFVNGSYTFTSGYDVGDGGYRLLTVDTSVFIATPNSLFEFDTINKSLHERAVLSFDETSIVSISDDSAYLINSVGNESYVYSCDLETGSLTEIMSSSDRYFSIFHRDNKLWASDYSTASLYDIATEVTTTIDDGKFSFVTSADSIDVALIKKPVFDGVQTIDGYVAKYDTFTGQQTLNYGSYSTPYVYLGWRGDPYRLAVDHDYYKLYQINFEEADSLDEIFESTGVITIPF